MPFVKVVKNKAYFKRFQTKFRRRREGKTDYYARRRLVVQDKNKYATPKTRLVVRISNNYVLCQIVRSALDHDEVIAQANSRELPRYGLEVGLKNYAAAYCTGLLVARRVLQKLGLDKKYQGVEEVTGEAVQVDFDDEDKPRPLRCFLDVGLHATTTGAKVFGAMKGAADGGLDIPHKDSRFPGYDREEKAFEPEVHRDRIFGAHVGEYLQAMSEGSAPAKYFDKYAAKGINADGLEELYTKVHAAIRADPSPAAKKQHTMDKQFKRPAKLTYEERKAKVAKAMEVAAAYYA
jgi:large subunit ribosomal protein L5e